jgi:ABC-2 type transport system ATP-binding protein
VIIEAQDLVKTYGSFAALRGLSLEVPEGSVFALLGANGAGKTTLIKILMNIIRPSSGRATMLGTDSRAVGPALLAKIGYVSESQLLPGRLRVEEFFGYLRACYAQWDRGTEAALRRQLLLPPDRRIGALSHGMRMKLALACALPFRPKLLVLDEPFSGPMRWCVKNWSAGSCSARTKPQFSCRRTSWMRSSASPRMSRSSTRADCCSRVRSQA